MTSRSEIQGWFERGVEEGATHMIVVCDTFDHGDYPVFVAPSEDVRERTEYYRNASMQRVMEVYNLNLDMALQLSQQRALNY